MHQLYSYHTARLNDAPQLVYSHRYDARVVTIQELLDWFNQLAQSKIGLRKERTYCVFLLDLLLSLNKSTAFLPVLDIPNPLYLGIQRFVVSTKLLEDSHLFLFLFLRQGQCANVKHARCI